MKLSDIKSNPQNPRICSDEKFDKLVKSIKEFPQMMGIEVKTLNGFDGYVFLSDGSLSVNHRDSNKQNNSIENLE